MISTPGFGSIEKKVNERQMATITQLDFATNLELGKFLPEKTGLKIPMHFDYSEIVNNPQYDPLNPDIHFKETLKSYDEKNKRDSVKYLSQDVIKRKSINFMNVKKTKVNPSAKSHVYDVENLDFTYAYTEASARNINYEYDNKKTYLGSIGYNYNMKPKSVTPFAKSKFLTKQKSLRLIKDFNFYYLPKSITFRTDLDRKYNEQLLRNKSKAIILLEPTYVKSFYWSRMYNFQYDLTQNLKLDFSANSEARIDEPQGEIDRHNSSLDWKRDSIWENIKRMGRITDYNHKYNIVYSLPINKIPLFNWINTSAQYSATYRYGAPAYSIRKMGGEIENSNTKVLNGTANLVNLYNKIGYLKNLNQGQKKSKDKNADIKNKKGDIKGGIDKGKNKDQQEDSTLAEKIDYFKLITDNTLKILMSVKNVSLNYTEGNGTLLPGFVFKNDDSYINEGPPLILGQDWNLMAPGTGFILGSQKDIIHDAARNHWFTEDTRLNQAFATKYTQNLSAKSSIEPIPDLKIQLTATRNFSKNYMAYYKADSTGNIDPDNLYSPTESGNFSISYLAWNTAFVKDAKDHSSQNFENFKIYRIIIAQRLADINPHSSKQLIEDTLTGLFFPDGYGPTSQDVLIPAFLAAYSGQSPGSVLLDPFPKIPKPNWRITYNGLAKIKFFKKYLKTLTIAHGYNSTYNIGNYISNVSYNEDLDGYQYVRDALGNNFIPKHEISQVSVMEQFSPLINFDMTWNNSLLSKIEVKKSRNLSLSFANNQLTEVVSSEISFNAGYKFKDVVLYFKAGGSRQQFKSDINLKAGFSIRTNKTVLRKLVEDMDMVSTGTRRITINVSGDYMISEKFTFRVFFDKDISNPFVSNQFPNSNTNAGISMRFSLAQ